MTHPLTKSHLDVSMDFGLIQKISSLANKSCWTAGSTFLDFTTIAYTTPFYVCLCTCMRLYCFWLLGLFNLHKPVVCEEQKSLEVNWLSGKWGMSKWAAITCCLWILKGRACFQLSDFTCALCIPAVLEAGVPSHGPGHDPGRLLRSDPPSLPQ